MDPRILLKRSVAYTSYTQYNAHAINEDLKKQIIELHDLIKNEPSHHKDTIIYRQLGIYFAFAERNKDLAMPYFQKYLTCCTTYLGKIEATCFINHTNVMDPTFHDEKPSAFLSEVPYRDREGYVSLLAIKAAGLRYHALMLHRQATLDQASAPIKLTLALEKIQKSVALHRELLKLSPPAKIVLAETLHIQGVITAKLGEITANQHHLLIADKLFTEATQLAKEVCDETKALHFNKSNTMQSQAGIRKQLGYLDQALQLAEAALKEQQIMFGTGAHRDIAKSLHIVGDAHHAKLDYVEAVEAYLKALICKMQIVYDKSFIIDATKKALLTSLNCIPEKDKQLAFDLRKKIYHAMTDETKTFINPCNDFVELIKNEMNALRDAISPKQAIGSVTFPAAPRLNETPKVIETEMRVSLHHS
jgi:tetratricopeptide (TPR) repeat protein